MPKGILKFNLPEEEHEFRCASRSMQLVRTISDLQDWFRNQLKYEDHDAKTVKALEYGRDLLFDHLRSAGFSSWIDE